MPREIVGKGLRFSLRHAPCAHVCRYCLISELRKRSALPFARFEQLVHRFHEWTQSSGRSDLQIPIDGRPSVKPPRGSVLGGFRTPALSIGG